jgi:hypothetical protein
MRNTTAPIGRGLRTGTARDDSNANGSPTHLPRLTGRQYAGNNCQYGSKE